MADLITKAQRAQLIANHRRSNVFPVVKLFLPGSGATWLLADLDPNEPSRAFGLCDLGLGQPEMGYVDLDELTALRHPRLGLPVERDLYWTAKKTLVQYADDARGLGRIQA